MKIKTYFFSIIVTSGCVLQQSEEEYFTEITGLEITEPIEIIQEGDNYVMGEGEY